MKLRIKKSELRECIENAVIMALNEAQQKRVVKEGYYDDDDDQFADVLAKNGYGRKVNGKWQGESEKNKYKRKDPKAAEARAQAMKDIKAETDAEKRDDKAAKDAEDREMKKDLDESKKKIDEGNVNYRIPTGNENPAMKWHPAKRPEWLDKACQSLGYKNGDEFLKLKRLGKLTNHQIYAVQKRAGLFKNRK